MSKKYLPATDLYNLLEINIDAAQIDIRTAYRKKALKCHPDKNPDNPEALKLFHELSKALEILTDSSARAAYDKLLKAKKAADLRNTQLDTKRRKLRDDLEKRERDNLDSSCDIKTKTDIFENEINRLRKEASKILEEEQKLLSERIQHAMSEIKESVTNDSIHNRVKIKWKTEKKDPLNGGYTKDNLFRFLNKYGDIIALVMSKKMGSAMVEFKTFEAADMAITYEKGYLENPLQLDWIVSPPIKEPALNSSSMYEEHLVLRKMQRAEERKRLIEQMENEDDESNTN